MSIKQDQAIAKITSEAMEMKNNFAIFIKEHLTGICTNDKVADKLLTGRPLKEFYTRKCLSSTQKVDGKLAENMKAALRTVMEQLTARI